MSAAYCVKGKNVKQRQSLDKRSGVLSEVEGSINKRFLQNKANLLKVILTYAVYKKGFTWYNPGSGAWKTNPIYLVLRDAYCGKEKCETKPIEGGPPLADLTRADGTSATRKLSNFE